MGDAGEKRPIKDTLRKDYSFCIESHSTMS